MTALMACAILFALAMLIIQLSTGDLKVSARNVGDKKAFSAAENGIQRLMQNFDRDNPTSANVTRAQVNAAADPNSRYTISLPPPNTPRRLPASLPIAGFSMDWGQECFERRVTGENTAYNSSVQIDVGMGYGPLPTGAGYR